MRTRTDQIRELESWLATHRAEYERARAAADPEAMQEASDLVLARLREILTSGPSRSPHYVLGQAREALRPLEQPEEFLGDWKRKSGDLARLNQEAEASRLSSGGESNTAQHVNPDDTLL